LQWHERFDALLSSHDFQKLNAKINYENQCLEINNVKIPFFIELNPLNFIPFSQRTNNHLKIPVNIENGPVVIPNLTNGKIIVPESIAIAKNGICTIPIPEIKTTEIHWKQLVDVQPLVNVNIEKPNVPKTNISETLFTI
jgi:hypothetical protein